MRNNIATLQRELSVFIMQENDYMVEKIQNLIDEEIKKQTAVNLNEIVEEENKHLNEVVEIQPLLNPLHD